MERLLFQSKRNFLKKRLRETYSEEQHKENQCEPVDKAAEKEGDGSSLIVPSLHEKWMVGQAHSFLNDDHDVYGVPTEDPVLLCQKNYNIASHVKSLSRISPGEWTWRQRLNHAYDLLLLHKDESTEQLLYKELGCLLEHAKFYSVLLVHQLVTEVGSRCRFTEILERDVRDVRCPKFRFDRVFNSDNGLVYTLVRGGTILGGDVGPGSKVFTPYEAYRVYQLDFDNRRLLLNATTKYIQSKYTCRGHVEIPVAVIVDYQGFCIFVEVADDGMMDLLSDKSDYDTFIEKGLGHVTNMDPFIEAELSGIRETLGFRMNNWLTRFKNYRGSRSSLDISVYIDYEYKRIGFRNILGLLPLSTEGIPLYPEFIYGPPSMCTGNIGSHIRDNVMDGTDRETISILEEYVVNVLEPQYRSGVYDSSMSANEVFASLGISKRYACPKLIINTRTDGHVHLDTVRPIAMDILGEVFRSHIANEFHALTTDVSSHRRRQVFLENIKLLLDRNPTIIDRLCAIALNIYICKDELWVMEWVILIKNAPDKYIIRIICDYLHISVDMVVWCSSYNETREGHTIADLIKIEDNIFDDFSKQHVYMNENQCTHSSENYLFRGLSAIRDEISHTTSDEVYSRDCTIGFYPHGRVLCPSNLTHRYDLLMNLISDTSHDFLHSIRNYVFYNTPAVMALAYSTRKLYLDNLRTRRLIDPLPNFLYIYMGLLSYRLMMDPSIGSSAICRPACAIRRGDHVCQRHLAMSRIMDELAYIEAQTNYGSNVQLILQFAKYDLDTSHGNITGDGYMYIYQHFPKNDYVSVMCLYRLIELYNHQDKPCPLLYLYLFAYLAKQKTDIDKFIDDKVTLVDKREDLIQIDFSKLNAAPNDFKHLDNISSYTQTIYLIPLSLHICRLLHIVGQKLKTVHTNYFEGEVSDHILTLLLSLRQILAQLMLRYTQGHQIIHILALSLGKYMYKYMPTMESQAIKYFTYCIEKYRAITGSSPVASCTDISMSTNVLANQLVFIEIARYKAKAHSSSGDHMAECVALEIAKNIAESTLGSNPITANIYAELGNAKLKHILLTRSPSNLDGMVAVIPDERESLRLLQSIHDGGHLVRAVDQHKYRKILDDSIIYSKQASQYYLNMGLVSVNRVFEYRGSEYLADRNLLGVDLMPDSFMDTLEHENIRQHLDDHIQKWYNSMSPNFKLRLRTIVLQLVVSKCHSLTFAELVNFTESIVASKVDIQEYTNGDGSKKPSIISIQGSNTIGPLEDDAALFNAHSNRAKRTTSTSYGILSFLRYLKKDWDRYNAEETLARKVLLDLGVAYAAHILMLRGVDTVRMLPRDSSEVGDGTVFLSTDVEKEAYWPDSTDWVDALMLTVKIGASASIIDYAKIMIKLVFHPQMAMGFLKSLALQKQIELVV